MAIQDELPQSRITLKYRTNIEGEEKDISLYEFENTPRDLFWFKTMGKLANASHAPFIAGASPRFFGCESVEEVEGIRTRGIMRIRLVGFICVLMCAATACGDVKPAKPPADAEQGAHVCKFDVDKFDAGCILASLLRSGDGSDRS